MVSRNSRSYTSSMSTSWPSRKTALPRRCSDALVVLDVLEAVVAVLRRCTPNLVPRAGQDEQTLTKDKQEGRTTSTTTTSSSKSGNTVTEKVTTTTTTKSPTSKITTTRVTTTSTSSSGARSPTKVASSASPTRSSPTRSSPTRSSPERSPSRSPERSSTRKSSTSSTSKARDTTDFRRSSTSSTTMTSMSTKMSSSSSTGRTKSPATTPGRLAGREAAREACPTDSITSSYGVGPTDDRGRPLFGLKALRRTNTNRSLSDAEPTAEPPKQAAPSPASSTRRAADITDSTGLPLFGGLRALKMNSTTTTANSTTTSSTTQHGNGPASPPLRDLVQRHEEHARESFLDSRRGILKKPRDEAVSSSYSRSTVVSQRQVVGPDGTVSLTRDVIRGETVAKPGQEPVTNVSREHYAYESPEPRTLSITQLDSEDEEVRGSRRSSPSPDRVLIESAQSSKRSSRNFEEDSKFSSSYRRTSGQDEFIRQEKSHSAQAAQNGDEPDKASRDGTGRWSNTVTSKKTEGGATTHSTTTTTKERRASGGVTSESTSISTKSTTTSNSTSPTRNEKSPSRDSAKKQTGDKWSSGSNTESKSSNRFSSHTSTSRTSSSSNLERRRSSAAAEDVTEEGSSTVSSSLIRTSQRGSVRALQEKFQKAAADAQSADSPRSNRSYPKAGLIFRSASFRSNSGDGSAAGSAPATPSSPNAPSTTEVGPNPTLKQSASMEVRVGSPVASPLPSTPGSAVTESRSFLNDRTAVTDVQDVLTRMRNADIVVENGDSAEDQAARSLLNKFLGASVILQGMEPLVGDHASSTSTSSARRTIAGGSSGTTTSAALVSQVERQRLSGAKVTNGSAKDPSADLDSIWDEAHLRTLLDACSDYEGRRKIRARLRTVMAEQKACEGVVAAAHRDENRSLDADTASSASSVHGKSESFKSSTSTDGNTTTQTEVRTKTSHFSSTSNMATNKGGPPKPISPFAKFQQLDRQNSAASAPRILK